jgi:hypothetical protein
MQTETKRNTLKSNNIALEQQLQREIHKTMWNRCILNYILKRPKTFPRAMGHGEFECSRTTYGRAPV